MTCVYTLNSIGRLLDELLFPEYRDTPLRPPVIITANPRSGTTFLYGLLGHDNESFVRVRLYHSLFPSVTLCRVFDFFAWADRAAAGRSPADQAARPGLFRRMGGHAPMGLERPEEDEALFLFCFATPALYMLFPFFREVPELAFADRLPEWKREAIARYYESSLRRILYAAGGADRTLLLKSVLFTGRMKTAPRRIPRRADRAPGPAPVRGPAVGHRHVLLVLACPFPGDPVTSRRSRGEWAQLYVGYYKYFHENRKLLDGSTIVSVRYPDLKEDPAGTVKRIYRTFGMTPGPGSSTGSRKTRCGTMTIKATMTARWKISASTAGGCTTS